MAEELVNGVSGADGGLRIEAGTVGAVGAAPPQTPQQVHTIVFTHQLFATMF